MTFLLALEDDVAYLEETLEELPVSLDGLFLLLNENCLLLAYSESPKIENLD